MSYSKVRALTRVATPEVEGSLLAMAPASTASHLERILRGYRRAATEATPEAEEDVRWFRDGARLGARRRLRGNADVAPPARECAGGRPRSVSPGRERRRAAGGGRHARQRGRHDARRDGAARADGRAPRLRRDRGRGRGKAPRERPRRRPAAAKNPDAAAPALRLRDRGCRFPGCRNLRVDGHHVVPWSAGGATSPCNLVSPCRQHSTFEHECGMRIDTGDDGAFRFVWRDGTGVPSRDERTGVPPDADALLRARNAGVAIDAMTAYPRH